MEVIKCSNEHEKQDELWETNGRANENKERSNRNETGTISSSILTLLDDKNKSISLLKRQVQNQKLQLAFYLRRGLNSPKITELSEECLPQEAEENIHVNLALNQFYKNSGLKSRIICLHDRMVNVEKRILRLVEQQEDMVRIIVNKFTVFAKGSYNYEGLVNYVSSNLERTNYEFEVLAKIFDTTTKLRKELETFRTCCNRLILIEDERNSLVEQVYSTPVAQRMNCSILLATQYENMRLEKEVSAIKREQTLLQARLATLYPGDSLENDRSIASKSQDRMDLQETLKSINYEAVSLLTAAKSQKEKHLEEIAKLRKINSVLTDQVASLQKDVGYKEIIEDKMEEAISEYQNCKEFSTAQLNEMHKKLGNLIEENDELRQKLKQYCDIEDQIKDLKRPMEEMDVIRRQRDYFKTQVDDLQAIRAACAQLVEKPFEKELDKKKIEEYQRQNDEMKKGIPDLNKIIVDQRLQIRNLLVIIKKMGRHTASQRNSIYKINVIKSSANDGDASKARKTSTTQTEDKSVPKTGYKAGRPFHSRSDVVLTAKEETIPTAKTNQTLFCLPQIKPSISTTSVRIHSVNREGISESMRAVLESTSPLDGLIQLNNSSAVSVRLTCSSNTQNATKPNGSGGIESIRAEEGGKSNLQASNHIKCSTVIMDEFAVLRKSSKETALATMHRQAADLLKMQRLEFSSDNEKIEEISGKRSHKADSLDVPQIRNLGEESDSSSLSDDSQNGDVEDAKFESNVTTRLKQITNCVDKTLAKPGGTDSLLNSVKNVYGTLFQNAGNHMDRS